MERSVIRDRAGDVDLASALLQFEPEDIRSTVAAGKADPELPAAPGKGKHPSSSKQKSFFAQTRDLPSESAPSFGADDTRADSRGTPLLFGEALASSSRGWSGRMIGTAAVLVVIAVGVPTSRWLLEPSVPAVKTGTLVIVTNPPGAAVLIDGTPGGTTPLNQKIAAGPHTVELRGAGAARTIDVTVSAGGQAFQYFDLPGAASNAGQLNLRSEPSGAFVTIDGVARGTTPIVADLAPGDHSVQLASDFGWVVQTVTIESGVMAALAVPATSWSVVAP